MDCSQQVCRADKNHKHGIANKCEAWVDGVHRRSLLGLSLRLVLIPLQALRERIGSLLEVISPLFSDGGKVEMKRWLRDGDNGATQVLSSTSTHTHAGAPAAGAPACAARPARGRGLVQRTLRRVGGISARTLRSLPLGGLAAADDEDDALFSTSYKEERPDGLHGLVAAVEMERLKLPTNQHASDSCHWMGPGSPSPNGTPVRRDSASDRALHSCGAGTSNANVV